MTKTEQIEDLKLEIELVERLLRRTQTNESYIGDEKFMDFRKRQNELYEGYRKDLRELVSALNELLDSHQ